MTNHTTKSITIYQKTYQLPVLEDSSFQKVQSKIKQRQQVIKTQKRVIIKQKTVQKKALFGLTSYTETIDVKTTEELSFEDKFHELERLVNDYDQLIRFITEHKQVYLQFFAQLTDDLKQVVKEKLKEASQQEKERLELLLDETDAELIGILEGQKEQILGNVWLFGKAFLLMLKKIELISEGTEKITTDQDAQRQLLIKMVGKLGKYKKVYNLQRKINKSGEEAEKMAETAVNLEQYLAPFIGSFQGLINQISQQDSTLSGTVNEIQSLVEDIMSSNTGSLTSSQADDLSKNMLDFLVTNEQKKEPVFELIISSTKD
jgi:succinate dehydrogenase flavin-adding protein (antitoxin of CptAB toxin-antitoxin module)